MERKSPFILKILTNGDFAHVKNVIYTSLALSTMAFIFSIIALVT